MRDIIYYLKQWREYEHGAEMAVATIVETRGSSLRPAGTRMVLNGRGEIVGSVSSGCVDGDVISELETVLLGKIDMRHPSFGVSDEEAWQAGLSCGGAIDVLVEHWSPLHDVLLDEVDAGRPVGFASLIHKRTAPPLHLLRFADGQVQGSLDDPDLDALVLADIVAAWPGPYAEKREYPQGQVFVEVIPPPPQVFILGATDIALALVELVKLFNYQVIVSDARRIFLTEMRFPKAERRFGWPNDVFEPSDFGPGSAVVVLFHDAKFDVPALSIALRSEASYIGLLGSRKTQADRRAALIEAGFTEQELTRIHGPIGLDIGGKDPAMIALSILAEMVAVRHRRSGGMMCARGSSV